MPSDGLIDRPFNRLVDLAQVVDELLELGDETTCDFVEKVSAPLPLAVIAWMLGVPREDWPLLFDWTNRIIGAGDPEFQGTGKG